MADGVEASRAFVDRRFPHSLAAILFGSTVTGKTTGSSDLDLIVIEKEANGLSHMFTEGNGWQFDVTVRSVKDCKNDVREGPEPWHRDGRLLFLMACAEGLAIRNHAGIAENLKAKSQAILDRGPRALSTAELAKYRQDLTKLVDDFVDARSDGEALFVAFQSIAASTHLLLGLRRQWSFVTAKVMYRSLENCDDPLARGLLDGLARYSQTRERSQLREPLDAVLNRAGGRLDEYSSGPEWAGWGPLRRGVHRLKGMIQRVFGPIWNRL